MSKLNVNKKEKKKQSVTDALQKRFSKKFCKFPKKTPVLESLFKKVAGLKACQGLNLIKKTFQHRCFPVKFVKFLRTVFFTEHLHWFLLKE